MTGIHIGDIGKLGVRNVQQLRKLQSVRRCLIEHNNELGVCQHRSCRVGLKQVVHILRDARGISAVLSYTLPKGEQEVCTVLVLEQKVDFIDEDEGVLALSSVLCNTVQDRVEDDQHTDGHKLLAEVKDVIADQAVIRVHIGFLGEGVQRAIGKQLNGKSNLLRFGFGLLEKLRPEVLQGRHLAGVVVLLIVAVDACRTAVNDGLLHCAEVVAADKLLAQGHNELGFQNNGVCTVTVFPVHIHRIDMGGRSGRDVDDLSAQRPHKGRILSLRVNDNNVCVAGKHLIDDLAFCGKGLTTARNTENKLVAVEELSAVCDDHIFGNDILTVVNAVGVANVLHTERDKDRVS